MRWTRSKAGDGPTATGPSRAPKTYWRRGRTGTGIEAVNWGRTGPNEMLTLNAMRVLVAAGRADASAALARR